MNRKIILILIVFFMCFPIFVKAQRGCCSHHGGVCGCSNGKNLCCDGTLSPSCTCSVGTTNKSTTTKKEVYGCTDKFANNYNSNATKNDGSCKYDVLGCMDSKSLNYNSKATKDDGNCEYTKGCIDPNAINYNKDAILTDGSCIYETIPNDEKKEDNENIVNDDNVGIVDNSENNDLINEIIEEAENEEVKEIKQEDIKGNKDNEKESNSSPADILIPIGLLGGGGYYLYNKYKKKK